MTSYRIKNKNILQNNNIFQNIISAIAREFLKPS